MNIILLFVHIWTHVRNLYADFDFNATGNPNNEWVNVYQSVMEAMADPLFFFFPFLDNAKWLTLSPKRQKVHHNLSKLLNMLSKLIKTKRELINSRANSISETESSETDILSLMIDSQMGDKEGGLTDEEIRVSGGGCVQVEGYDIIYT